MILDFHCHITTPGSKLPISDGVYYRQMAPVTPAGNFLGTLTQDAVDAMAERWRTPGALRAYRNIGPFIYTEMSRRLTATDTSVLLAEMADNDIHQAVVVAMDPYVPTSEVLRACQRLSGLLIPFGSVDPNTDDFLDRFEELLTLPICGIKYHSDLQELPIESPKLAAMMRILEKSPQAHLPVYLHTGNFPIYRPNANPWEKSLPGLVAAFPSLTFVCGHAGWDSAKAALRTALKYPNLYLETSWQPPQTIRRLCDKLGPERLLFGSDYPLYSQKRALRNCRQALHDDEFLLVSGENARKLLRIS